MTGSYDVFVSYAWADRPAVEPIVDVLRDHGLQVFVDDAAIDDFQRVTSTVVAGLTRSKVLLAYYSAIYATRRACQWELTAAYLAASRTGDPARRILVVNPEPSAEHLHPGELRDALFRRAPAPNDTASLVGLAEAVGRHVGALSSLLGEVVPSVPPRWLPTQGLGSTRFVGRLADMWRLHSALHPETTWLTAGRTGPAVAQVRGLGGIGKSLLAEEYALRFGSAYPGGVFWLRAYGSHDQTDLPREELDARRHDGLRRLASGCGLDLAGRDPEELSGLLAGAIERAGRPCLWVVDDLPMGLRAGQVRAWLAPHPLACTLLTTRSHAYGALARAVDLGVLGDDESYELLTSHRPPDDRTEEQAAHNLVAMLGGHPLALEIAGSALRNQRGLVTYGDFLADLEEPQEDVLELVVELADTLPTDHEVSIAQTLLRSVSQLGAEGRDFLRLAASLSSAPIPAQLVAVVFEEADGSDDKQAARHTGQAIEQTASLSLATRAAADDAEGWLVHALVARVMRFHEPAPARQVGLRAAAIRVLTEMLAAIVDARAYTGLKAVIPHARELTRRADTNAEATLLGWVARYDHVRGEYPAAELLYRRHLDACRRLLGPDHPDTLGSMNDLALTLRAKGDLGGARDLHRYTLDARRRLLGPDHPDTLGSMNNLATTLHSLGDLRGARRFYQHARDAAERSLGSDHPNTLTAANNLAEILRDSGELHGARDLHQQTLDGHRRVLGPDHPDTLGSMNNLALTLDALGDLANARDLRQQALDAARRLWGPDHPTTLTFMNNLAQTLGALGDLDGARDLFHHVLDASRRLLGPDHPNTLATINNEAHTLFRMRDLAGARDLHRQALDGCLRVLGPDHPDTLGSMNNLALTLDALGDLANARDLRQQALDAARRLWGPDHPTTLNSMNNLAMTLYRLGDLASAQELLEHVLGASRRLFGPEHPTTKVAIGNLTTIAQGPRPYQ